LYVFEGYAEWYRLREDQTLVRGSLATGALSSVGGRRVARKFENLNSGRALLRTELSIGQAMATMLARRVAVKSSVGKSQASLSVLSRGASHVFGNLYVSHGLPVSNFALRMPSVQHYGLALRSHPLEFCCEPFVCL
jgi:hypothetical protein